MFISKKILKYVNLKFRFFYTTEVVNRVKLMVIGYCNLWMPVTTGHKRTVDNIALSIEFNTISNYIVYTIGN